MPKRSTMAIADYIAIAKALLIQQGIPENTVNSDIVETELQAYLQRSVRKFFGLRAPTKVTNFVMEAEGGYNQIFEKQPLAHGAAWYWLYRFYTDSVPSNRSTVRKKSNNGENVSVMPDKLEAAHNCDTVNRNNRNLVDLNPLKFGTVGEVTASGVLSFTASQMLAVGQDFAIDGIECTVATETSEGLAYTFTETETVPVGPAFVEYEIDTTGWANYPRLSASSILNF